MGRYANRTHVTQDRSKTEIERTLSRYGATHFMAGNEPGRAILAFQVNKRFVRMVVPIPPLDSFSRDARQHQRTPKAAAQSQAQAIKQRWRALALVVKANLEAVAAEVATFEQAFLPYLVLPGGETMSERMLPQLEAMYLKGKAPVLSLTMGAEA